MRVVHGARINFHIRIGYERGPSDMQAIRPEHRVPPHRRVERAGLQLRAREPAEPRALEERLGEVDAAIDALRAAG